MRLALAASWALILAAPALAAGASAVHVGLVVTGKLASPLIGAWHSGSTAPGAPYQFVVSSSSGRVYEFVSIPVRDAGTCDLRVSGVIYSLEPTSRARPSHGPSYELQYAIRSADVVNSSTDSDTCEIVAAAYLSDIQAVGTHSLTLSRTGEGRLIDGATGAEYTRTR